MQANNKKKGGDRYCDPHVVRGTPHMRGDARCPALHAFFPEYVFSFSVCVSTMDGNGAGAGSSGGGGGSVGMDLQALMMGSESLLTHIARPDGIPRLDKSLAEIVSATVELPLSQLYVIGVPRSIPPSDLLDQSSLSLVLSLSWGCFFCGGATCGGKPPRANGHSVFKLLRWVMFLLSKRWVGSWPELVGCTPVASHGTGWRFSGESCSLVEW